jgi:plasmid stabilization system protein ParE
LIKSIEVLEKQPEIGKKFLVYENFILRRLNYKKYRVIYLLEKDNVKIIRIVHQSKAVDEDDIFL